MENLHTDAGCAAKLRLPESWQAEECLLLAEVVPGLQQVEYVPLPDRLVPGQPSSGLRVPTPCGLDGR